jgi:hypothetical protein
MVIRTNMQLTLYEKPYDVAKHKELKSYSISLIVTIQQQARINPGQITMILNYSHPTEISWEKEIKKMEWK